MIKVIATLEDLQVAEATVHGTDPAEHEQALHEAFAKWNGHEVEHLAHDALALLMEKNPEGFLLTVLQLMEMLAALQGAAEAMSQPATGGGYLEPPAFGGGPHPTAF